VLAADTAAAIQTALADGNADIANDERVQIRIGINLGDVIEDRGEVYGDGVNLAARLEAAAEPGGICLSGTAHDQVEGKVAVNFTDGGKQDFKNIDRPVRVFRWAPGESAAKARDTAPALPDKPSIAVLPFNNMSGDPEQEYFSDGITEDIITELSRYRDLFVIARNSSFAYKGQAVDIGKVGRELGVAYVLEGSVRKAGDRVRITAQLIEAPTGSHIWAERYDRQLEDIFAVQDEVTQAIVSVLPVRIHGIAMERSRSKPSENMTAYEHELHARWLWNQNSGDPEPVVVALKQAIKLDPEFARAHAWLALNYADYVFTSPLAAQTTIDLCRHHAQEALRHDDQDSWVQAVAAIAFTTNGDNHEGELHANRAILLNPNDYMAIYARGFVLCYSGFQEQAMAWFERAQRLDPLAPEALYEAIIECQCMLGAYDDAIAIYHRWPSPPFHMLSILAVCHALNGELEAAHVAMERLRVLAPAGYDPVFAHEAHVRMFKRQEDKDFWAAGNRKIGLLA
jgi:adenylate cyclase